MLRKIFLITWPTLCNGLNRVKTWFSARYYLVVFDRTPAGRARTWEERLTREDREAPGGKVTVISG